MKLKGDSINWVSETGIFLPPLPTATPHLRFPLLQRAKGECGWNCTSLRTYTVLFTGKLHIPWFYIWSLVDGFCGASATHGRICTFFSKDKTHSPSIFCRAVIFPYPSLWKICNSWMVNNSLEKKNPQLKQNSREFSSKGCFATKRKGFARFFSAFDNLIVNYF